MHGLIPGGLSKKQLLDDLRTWIVGRIWRMAVRRGIHDRLARHTGPVSPWSSTLNTFLHPCEDPYHCVFDLLLIKDTVRLWQGTKPAFYAILILGKLMGYDESSKWVGLSELFGRTPIASRWHEHELGWSVINRPTLEIPLQARLALSVAYTEVFTLWY